jgi:hypothetical protein
VNLARMSTTLIRLLGWLAMEEDTIKCRIQYINDLDPFVSTCDRQPMIPLQYMLVLNQPICEQLPDIIRKLKAPHKVC